jgi:outer membrane protein OmpA-like peptidoglycan-associated protein
MSITASEMTPADIAAVTNNGGNGFDNGFGGDGWWVLLLWLAMMNGGWGMNGMYGGMMGGMGGFGLYPWLDNSQNINDGFRDQMLNNNVTSIRDGIANLSTQLCNCCGDMQMALANGFAGVEQGANARQIANMQQAFANQTAMMQGFNASQAQLAQASADNSLGIANLGSDIAREACATRTNDTQNTQAILNVINGGIQSIKDQLCQDKIDAKNDEIAQLRQEVLFARGKDSQDLQTAQITNDIYNRLSTCPVSTVPVAGNTPLFSCNPSFNNGGYNGGCGCGSF